MTIESYYRCLALLSRQREGPLGCCIGLIAEQLKGEGHCQQGAWRNLRVVSDFCHWLAQCPAWSCPVRDHNGRAARSASSDCRVRAARARRR